MPDPSPNFNQFIIPHNSTIIIGLSGGPDSIYALHQLRHIQDLYNLTIIAAHLDHEWQESSKIAVQICKDVCAHLGIALVVQKLSELKFDAKWNGSQEELGRTMRRHFFTTLAHEHQASAIVLAHHLHDQHETFFIRLLRGSSLKGLTCMRERDGLYIRPMLQCTKQEILTYLATHNIPYYTDPTNNQDTYLRNRIRNHVLPALQHVDHRCDQKLTSTIASLTDVEDFLQSHTLQTLASLTSDQGVSLDRFLLLHNVMQQRILLHLIITEQVPFTPSQKMFKEIMRFLEKSSSNKHILHNFWMIEKNKFYFKIKKIS